MVQDLRDPQPRSLFRKPVGGHEVVRAARGGAVRVDMDDPASIDGLFATVPDVDAVICCAASGKLT
ncbi:hypothetical protein, partial [Nocardia wallacei]|uniref:hypothetical protein n=1 Tax=Nocardia wallacei TaxID=480035 RepID=UPI0024540859